MDEIEQPPFKKAKTRSSTKHHYHQTNDNYSSNNNNNNNSGNNNNNNYNSNQHSGSSGSSSSNSNSNGNSDDANERIKVAVRLRPLLGSEMQLCELVCNPHKKQVGAVVPSAKHHREGNKLYSYDIVYDKDSSQKYLFDTSILPIINDVLSGYNCTVFAYGQTGSGKTYTMEGNRFQIKENSNNGNASFVSNSNNSNISDDISDESDETDGIIPRCIDSIFKQLDENKIESTVIVSHLEIYNEDLTDLLCPINDCKKKLTIYQDSKTRAGVFVQGLEEIVVSSPKEIFDILQKSTKKRQVASTNLNDRSSRSHCIFTVIIRMKQTVGSEDIVKTGTLNLVDLAGSESIARSGAQNERAIEAGHINTSLLTLGRVISALVERRQHIPYRESKLTRLLQESLGGRNKTLLIATISPNSPLEQTLSTLDYALRAKSIQNKPEINVSMTHQKYVKEMQLMISNYKRQIDALRAEKGIILPPTQYEEMKANLKNYKKEISRLNSLFEAKKKDYCEVNKLLENTNDELNEIINEKDNLLVQIDELTKELEKKMIEIKGHKYVIDKYNENEKILKSQAVETKTALEKVLNEKNMLHDRIEHRQKLEQSNVKQYDSQEQKLSSLLVNLRLQFGNFSKQNETNVNNAINNITQLSNQCNTLETMTKRLNDTYNITLKQNMSEMQTENRAFTSNIAKELSKCKDNISNECETLSNGLLGTFIESMSNYVNSIQTNLNNLKTQIENDHKERLNEVNTFGNSICCQLNTFFKELTDCHEKEKKILREWNEQHSTLLEQSKLAAMKQIESIFDGIKQTQANAFNQRSKTLSNNLMEQSNLVASNKSLVDATISENGASICTKLNESKLHYASDIGNISKQLSNLSSNELKTFDNSMKLQLAGLVSNNLENDDSNNGGMQKENYPSLASLIDQTRKHEKSQSNKFAALSECINNCGKETKSQLDCLTSHNKNMMNHGNATVAFREKHNNDSVTMINKIDEIRNAVKEYNFETYKKTGQTPLKQDPIYPTNFVESKPFGDLMNEFNQSLQQNENSSNNNKENSSGNGSYYNKERSCDYPPEVEINFTEDKLGIQIYSAQNGNNNNNNTNNNNNNSSKNGKNIFVRGCTCDCRVADGAQIIAIDGISAINKSVNYIKTLLSTTQRPLTIKFRNPPELCQQYRRLERSAPRSKSKSKSKSKSSKSKSASVSHCRTPMLSPAMKSRHRFTQNENQQSSQQTPLSQIRPRTATSTSKHDNSLNSTRKRFNYQSIAQHQLQQLQQLEQLQQDLPMAAASSSSSQGDDDDIDIDIEQQNSQLQTVSTAVSGIRAPKLYYTTPTRSDSKKQNQTLSPIKIDDNENESI